MDDVFQAILRRAELPDAAVFTADEVALWPQGVLGRLVNAGILRKTKRAEEIVCRECEQGCWIKPVVRQDPRTGKRMGTYFCKRNDDVGHFKVDLSRRQRWASSFTGLARAAAKAVKTTGKPVEAEPGRLALLGTLRLDGKTRELFLARGAAWKDAREVFGGAVRLKAALCPAMLTLAGMPPEDLLPGRQLAARPLVEIASFDGKGLHVSLDSAFAATEPRPWADIPNEPITLDEFMARCCEKRTQTTRRYRRKALLAAARNGTVSLPPLAAPHRSGQAKCYFTHDLLRAWQGFVDEGVDLPLLSGQRGACHAG